MQCRRKLITALYGAVQSFVSFLRQRISLSKFSKFHLRWAAWFLIIYDAIKIFAFQESAFESLKFVNDNFLQLHITERHNRIFWVHQ